VPDQRPIAGRSGALFVLAGTFGIKARKLGMDRAHGGILGAFGHFADLLLAQGEITTIVGLSGHGKLRLLRKRQLSIAVGRRAPDTKIAPIGRLYTDSARAL
jgi:hypothetical protein